MQIHTDRDPILIGFIAYLQRYKSLFERQEARLCVKFWSWIRIRIPIRDPDRLQRIRIHNTGSVRYCDAPQSVTEERLALTKRFFHSSVKFSYGLLWTLVH
jgi:hypothetical protein